MRPSSPEVERFRQMMRQGIETEAAASRIAMFLAPALAIALLGFLKMVG